MVFFQCLSARIKSLRENWRKYFYAWRISLFLIGVVVSNRFANYSITGVYMDFLTSEWDTPIYAAAMIINLKEALTSLFSIFGATYATHTTSGRYHAIRFSLLPFIIGLGLFTVAALERLHMGVRISLFSVSLLFTAMGEGMQKHTVFHFGYDQFKYQMDDGEKAKRQANIWWGAARFAGTVGGLVASSLLIQFLDIKSMSWWVFGGILSSGLTLLTSIIFILGKLSFYRAKISGKSPIVDVLKVVVAAIRKRHLPYATDARFIYAEERNPITDPLQQIRSTSNESAQENPGNLVEMPQAIKTIEEADQVVVQDPSNQFDKEELAGVHGYSRNLKLRCLEKASIIESPARIDIHVKQWRLCPSNNVQYAKMVFGLLPLWSTFLMFQVVKAMGDTFFLEQGDAMQSSISSVDITLAILLSVQRGSELLITQLLSLLKKVPKLKDGIPPLFRIGIGLFISICCCIVAGMVERRRLSKVVSDQDEAQMSIFWLVPQCFLLGAASGFAEDGVSDFFDERVPPNLRVCYRLTSESVKGVGVLINSGILAVIYLFSTLGSGDDWIGKELNTSKLDIVYFIIAGMSAINLLLYFFVSRKFCRSRQDDQQPLRPVDKIPKEDQSPLPTRQDGEQEDGPGDIDPDYGEL